MRIAVLTLLSAILAITPAGAQDFTLSPGDVIAITVLEDTSLNRRALVRPDGKISMPIAGTIVAGGRTPEQVERTIVSLLRDDFVTEPTVSVALFQLGPDEEEEEEEEIETIKIYVLGEVARPGQIVLEEDEPVNALQALALAGGPGVFAATKRIQIRKQLEDGEQIIVFNYHDVQDGKFLPAVITLGDGDVIVVPERGLFE